MRAKIGMVGVGATVGIAYNHAQGLIKDPRADIAAVYDLDKERAAAFAARYSPAARVCESPEELFSLVDAVDICTPNFTHADYVVRTAQAHRGVFVEKPLAVNLEECRRAAEAVEKAGVFNMVGFVYRFAPHAAALRELIRTRFTKIYSISGSYGARRLADPTVPFEWRMDATLSGGGALDDFGSHLLDLLFFSCGVKIKKAACLSTTSIPRRAPGPGGKELVENDDSSALTAVGERGELVSLLMTRLGMDDIALRVSGDGGLVVLSYGDDFITYYPKETGGAYQGEPQRIALPGIPHFQGWFDREMAAFVDGVLGKETEVCSVRDALAIQQALDAAARSAREEKVCPAD